MGIECSGEVGALIHHSGWFGDLIEWVSEFRYLHTSVLSMPLYITAALTGYL